MRLLWAAVLGLSAIMATSGCASRAQAQKPLTYVAIGASDAVGVGARDPETEGWVPRLGATLGPNVRVVNLGVSGSTLSQALAEHPEYGSADGFRPSSEGYQALADVFAHAGDARP